MAGIYIHVPFCKTRCIYCDFCSTTRYELKARYVEALCRELRMRKDYLGDEPVETVYFGGGTPSLLGGDDFEKIFRALDETFGLGNAAEITLEANPDDLTEEYVAMLSGLLFNRLSMGVQTFDDGALKLLGRRHGALQAIRAVERCRASGFANISIDLIYGLPGETDSQWARDLELATALGVEHISAYLLTCEKDTPLYRMLLEGKVCEVDEKTSLRFFYKLTEQLDKAGYIHYEISNFCRPGYQSRHNSSYWEGIPYLGCGPSAHSFDTRSREWNTSSLETYITSIEQGWRPYEKEMLDENTRYNEYIMTGLRTKRGVSLRTIEERFGTEMRRYSLRMAYPHLQRGTIRIEGEWLRLEKKGVFVSNDIISDFMRID